MGRLLRGGDVGKVGEEGEVGEGECVGGGEGLGVVQRWRGWSGEEGLSDCEDEDCHCHSPRWDLPVVFKL